MLSHETVATAARIRPRTNGPIDVTITRGHRAGRASIRVHHAPLDASEITLHEGLRVTSPARTLLDLAATITQAELDRAMNEAQVLRLTTPKSSTPTLPAARPAAAQTRYDERSGRSRSSPVPSSSSACSP